MFFFPLSRPPLRNRPHPDQHFPLTPLRTVGAHINPDDIAGKFSAPSGRALHGMLRIELSLSLSSFCGTSELCGPCWYQTLQPVHFSVFTSTKGELSLLGIYCFIHGGHCPPLCKHSCDNDQCRNLLNDHSSKETEDIGPSFLW